MDSLVSVLIATLVLSASILSLAAALGLLRFPDVLTRVHAVTKPQVLGLIFVLAGIALSDGSWITFFTLLPVFIFQALTAPVSAHMVGRASYRVGAMDPETVYTDELKPEVEEATERTEKHPE